MIKFFLITENCLKKIDELLLVVHLQLKNVNVVKKQNKNKQH